MVADALTRRDSAARSSWSRSRTEGDVSAAPLAADRRHRRLRQRAARRAAARRGRRRRALAQGPADRARRRASRSPPCPLREDPRDVVVARDGLTLGELPGRRAGRHRLAAPGRAAARPRPRSGGGRRSAATSTPGSARSPTGSSTPSSSRAPGWPGSAGSTRSPRCSTRSRCSPPPGRVRWRSSAAPTTPTCATSIRAAPRRPAHPGRASRPSGPCSPRSRPGARPRSARWPRWPRATTATSSGCGRWRCRPTARCRVRRSATGPLDDAVGRRTAGWPAEMLADGAAELINAPARRSKKA